MSKFLHADDNDDEDDNDNADNTKVIAIPWVFFEYSRAEKAGPKQTLFIDRTRFSYWQSMLKVTVTLNFTPMTPKSKGNIYSI